MRFPSVADVRLPADLPAAARRAAARAAREPARGPADRRARRPQRHPRRGRRRHLGDRAAGGAGVGRQPDRRDHAGLPDLRRGRGRGHPRRGRHGRPHPRAAASWSGRSACCCSAGPTSSTPTASPSTPTGWAPGSTLLWPAGLVLVAVGATGLRPTARRTVPGARSLVVVAVAAVSDRRGPGRRAAVAAELPADACWRCSRCWPARSGSCWPSCSCASWPRSASSR